MNEATGNTIHIRGLTIIYIQEEVSTSEQVGAISAHSIPGSYRDEPYLQKVDAFTFSHRAKLLRVGISPMAYLQKRNQSHKKEFTDTTCSYILNYKLPATKKLLRGHKFRDKIQQFIEI